MHVDAFDVPLFVASFALPVFGMSLSVIFVYIYIVEPGRDICIDIHSVYTHIFMTFEMRLNVPIFMYVYICIMSVCIHKCSLFIHLLVCLHIYTYSRAHTHKRTRPPVHIQTHTHTPTYNTLRGTCVTI